MSTNIESTIRRHLEANDSIQETIGWAEIVGRLEAEAPILQVDAEASTLQVLAPIRRRRVGGWVAVAAAVTTLVLIGVLPLLSGNDGTPSVGTIVPTPPTTVAESVVTVPTSLQWNATLAQAKARHAPPVATCPSGSNPDILGPADQQRPWGASWSNQAAVFDVHAGRIIFIDERSETWTFDVCTNTWEKANPTFVGGPIPRTFLDGELVYDVDSDRTIAFGEKDLGVYDANTNTWTQRSKPSDYDIGLTGLGAVYDPLSGLVLVRVGSASRFTDPSELVAYDVESDGWIPVGEIGDGEYQAQLIGHIADTKRIAFLDTGEPDDEGMVVDPRTGESEGLKAPGNGVVFGWFGRLGYATSTQTPVVEGDGICRLDPANLDWTCVSLVDGPDSDGEGQLGAIVGDPINNRIVLIYGYGPGYNGERFYDVNDIWAIDFETGEWTQLLQQTGEMTYELEE